MNEKYTDPPNVESTIEHLKSIKTLGDIKKYVETIYPDWIVGFCNGYSPDYPHFTQNWYKVYEKAQTKPTQIMFVRELYKDTDNYKLLRVICDIFSLSGFAVRTQGEFTTCIVCNLAIPREPIYDLLRESKETSILLPSIWSQMCVKCK